MKEEPQAEEHPQTHGLPGYSAFCQDGAAGALGATERARPLKPREGSPMAKSNLLSQDISVKVASELLMKLSGEDGGRV